MMKLPSLFKRPSHRQFTYEPRHYDPDKEELAARLARAKYDAEADRNSPDYEPGRTIKGAMRQQSRLQRKGGDFSQVIFVSGFAFVMGAYWYFGPWALLSLIGLVYLYIRLKQ